MSKFRLLVIGLASLLVVGQFILFRALIASGDIPNPLAIHWGFSGQPDGFSDANAYLFGVTVFYLAMLFLLSYFGFVLRRRLLQPLLFGLTGLMFSFLFLLFSLTVLIQVGIEAEEAALSPWMILAILTIPLGLAVLGLRKPQVDVGGELIVKLGSISALRLQLGSITAAKQTELRAIDYGGLGIRYAKKTLAFIPSGGPGVLIHTNFGESVAIRTDKPEELVAKINKGRS